VAVLGMGFFYYTFPYIMNEQAQKIRDNDRIPEEQKERIIEKMTESQHPPIWQMAIAPAGTVISLIIVAAILFFVFNVLMLFRTDSRSGNDSEIPSGNDER
jgi:hypothetical protein